MAAGRVASRASQCRPVVHVGLHRWHTRARGDAGARTPPAPDSGVFFIGGIAILISSAVQSWFWAGLALHADQLEPATARALLDVAAFFGPILTGATTTMMAPVTLLALRNKAGLPMWLGRLGAAAFVEQSVETITIFGSTGFTQPGGAMNLQLGAGLTLAWMMAFGLWGGLRGRARSIRLRNPEVSGCPNCPNWFLTPNLGDSP
jgi:hypothetical protein